MSISRTPPAFPLKPSDYNNAASSIALGVPTHTADAPTVWSIFGLFPYPVFSYKDKPSVNVDSTKGKLHLYKADGTEVTVATWVTTGNINNAFGVLARLGNDFTPILLFMLSCTGTMPTST